MSSAAGDVITVNPGEMHDGVPSGGCVRRWRMLYFDPPCLNRAMLPEIPAQAEFKAPSLSDPGLAGLVLSLFRHVAVEGDPLAAEEHLVRLAVPLLQFPPLRVGQGGASSAVAKAKALIDDDPASPVTLSELAALQGISRFQLVRAFARELGTTPHAYVVQRRVRLARQLLLAGETPRAPRKGRASRTRAEPHDARLCPGTSA